MSAVWQPQEQVHSCAVRVCAGDVQGNAVYLGDGTFLTAAHVIGTERVVRLAAQGSGPWLAVPDRTPGWEGARAELAKRDLCLLRLDTGEAPPPLRPAVLAPLDRWARLGVGSLLPTVSGGLEHRVRAGTLGAGDLGDVLVPDQAREPLRRLRLDEPSRDSLKGCSGSGVFDQRGHLVGILCSEERWEAAGGTAQVYCAALEGWPELFPDGVHPGEWRPLLPQPWARGESFLADEGRSRRLYGREPLLERIQAMLRRPGSGGYLVLLGGPRRGKTAIMAELIRRAGPAGCPWVFAVRGQTGVPEIARALADQLGYLLGRRPDQIPPYDGQAPHAVVGPLLTEWSRRGGQLVLYLDALDEMDGAENVPFLPKPLPDGVIVVVSLRHEPGRRAEVTRFRPCLGVLQWDRASVDLELGEGTPYLADAGEIRDSDAEAIAGIWEAFGRRDCGALPAELRARIDDLGWPVGFHAAYARMLGRRRESGEDWPQPAEIPVAPGDINEEFWTWLSRRGDWEDPSPQELGHKIALGLLAAARRPVPLGVLRSLAGWADADRLNRFLREAGPVLAVYQGRVTQDHISWRDMVQVKLAGEKLADCDRLLAEGTVNYPMEDLDRDYWLQFRLPHLAEVLRRQESTRPQKEAAARDWAAGASDPAFLAESGAHPEKGVDLLVLDLYQGSAPYQGRAQPLISQQADWHKYRELLERSRTFLRGLPRS